MTLTLHFLGAAETVTGSKFLVETDQALIMVDCGLFQGLRKLRRLNWEPLPMRVGDIDSVLLTHGHLDHTGYLPRLARDGFRGLITGTTPTLDIARLILTDSARIQEEEARKANREGYSRHQPAQPLYTLDEAEATFPLFHPVEPDRWVPLAGDLRARFRYNGHILGATFIELEAQGRRLVFSGDIGRPMDWLLYPPKQPERADVLVLESTYGDRLHPVEDIEERLSSLIKATLQNKGTILIPSFAVERSQVLLYLLWKLQRQGRLPGIPLILDTPMGQRALEIFAQAPEWHKLPQEEALALARSVQTVASYQETWDLAANPSPKIIVTGSGMLTGGRILTYLQTYLDQPETLILLTGYQAEGTRGRLLLDGAPDLKIYGRRYPVRARVESLQGLSAHADQGELLAWLEKLGQAPDRLFIVHGEPQAADALRVKIKDTYGWEAEIPVLGQRVVLG